MLLRLWCGALAALVLLPPSHGLAEPAGMRKLPGKHLTLVTDLPADPLIDEMPRVFDAAFEPWCEYFGVSASQHADWHVTGYLVHSKERFEQAGLWRADLPAFLNGYSLGSEFWLYDQTSVYYRRHLMLHEGVHSFMSMLVGTAAPPWYVEGIAELLGAHEWRDGRLTVNYFPQTKAEMQQFGRMKIVQEGYAAGHPLNVADVLAYDARAHLRVEPYGWSWALAAFLDGHPRYRERFRSAPQWIRDKQFDATFRRAFADDWQQLNTEWQVFVANLDYGYDFERMAIDFRPGQPLGAKGGEARIAVDHGWQSTGLRLEAGKTYRLRGTGRYQVAEGKGEAATAERGTRNAERGTEKAKGSNTTTPWWCEPGGVTIRYYHGQPLGILLAAVNPDDAVPAKAEPSGAESQAQSAVRLSAGSDLAHPAVIGLDGTLTPEYSGTLYCRINESAAGLVDNRGELTVTVEGEGGTRKSERRTRNKERAARNE